MKKSGFLFLGALFFTPFLASANVVINEVAWMGILGNQYGEWIEIYNNGNEEIDLNNWQLYKNKDGSDTLIFTLTKKISSGGYLVIERTTDSSPDPLPDINDEFGKFGGGSLVNLPAGEHLILKNAENAIIENLDFSGGWPAGDNTTKRTMQWSGSVWITATATPKALNVSVSESQSSQQQDENSSTPVEANESSSSGGGDGGSSTYIPPENLPKIKADAGEDKIVTVGASIEFRGKAYGLDDKPLDNARYLWTFGDGASKEGQNITHIYRYPGDYIVFLNVSSGEYAATDKILVKAIPNQVFISEVKTGADSFIELQNKSSGEIDISGVQLKSGTSIFIFPQNSRIKAGAYLVIPSAVSNIVLTANQGTVEMFYSGGFKADSFGYKGILGEGQSFNRGEGNDSFIGQETPGAKNQGPTLIKSTSNQEPVLAKAVSVDNPEQEEPAPQTADNQVVENSVQSEENIGEANIIKSEIIPETKSNFKIYLLATFGLAIFSVVTIVFMRHRAKPIQASALTDFDEDDIDE